jgi:hypothetical protein
MILTDAQLAEIEDLAGLFLTADEIAVLIDVDIKAFMSLIADHDSPAYIRYFRGKSRSKKEIRANVVKMAKHGSPQAEELVDQYITNQGLFERRSYEQ